MSNHNLIITPKNPKGEDGHKTFSIRIKDDLVSKLDQLAAQTSHSRNELIGLLLEFAIDHAVIEEK